MWTGICRNLKFGSLRIVNKVVLWNVYSLWIICGVFGLLIDSAASFNLDIEQPNIQRGETGSMFGYSVAQHFDQQRGWILVGAPRAQTRQPGIIKGGAVYRCSVDINNSCQEIPFDETGNDRQYNGTYYLDKEDKSYQWFGATVKSSGSNGYILACAPRYVYTSNAFDKREPVGTCYLARSLSTRFQEFSPCRTYVDLYKNVDQYHRQGYCMAGFSISMSKNGRRLLIGSPGAFYWQGQAYSIWLDDASRMFTTREGPASHDDTYLGYSSAVGKFDDDDDEDYVVGIPRGGEFLKGKITLFKQDLTIIRNISGEQIGAYFGYALAVQDLDGNKLDDIIVGAPLYSDYKSTTNYDAGRVYIYYQNNRRKFRPNKRYDIIDGHSPKSRFGSALTGLGDINFDGYNDLAIGAPYGGKDGTGAVYIYHGSMKGIITEVSQVISGKDIGYRISTFGFSLSGGQDMDRNRYPDLLVGAYEAQTAALLRARPVVRVAASLRVDPRTISLDRKLCENRMSNLPKRVTCVNVFTCITYDGIGVPENLDFDFTWKFDTLKNITKRMFKLHSLDVVYSYTNIPLRKNETWCNNTFVYIKENLKDKLTPLVVDLDFKLTDSSDSGFRVKRQARQLRPILDQYTPTVVKAAGHIEKHCGPDEVCIPDLYVRAFRTTNDPYYTLGSKSTIEIIVQIGNKASAEDSYETTLYIMLPPGVRFNGIKNQEYEIIFSCGEEQTENGTEIVICDMGNPLPNGEKSSFTLILNPYGIEGNQSTLTFDFNVNSTNAERAISYGDNSDQVEFVVKQYADLVIVGQNSREMPSEQVRYNDTGVKLYKGTGYGPPVVHEYTVSNKGTTAIVDSEINIYWPSFDDLGNNLLFLTQPPEILGNPENKCQIYVQTPLNSSLLQSIIRYRENRGRQNNVSVVVQPQTIRTRRSTDSNRDKRDTTKKIYCSANWCTVIRCTMKDMKPDDSVLIIIRSRIWTNTLVKRGLTSEPYYITSQAAAKVQKMPYNIKVDERTFLIDRKEVGTYVNAQLLAPQPHGVEPWIIAVAVCSGILLLLLLIVLLWWCGFFKRRRPEEPPYSKPLLTNGQHSKNIVSRQYD